MRRTVVLIMLILNPMGVKSQGTQFRSTPIAGNYRYPHFQQSFSDSIAKRTSDTVLHSPKKATILALALPGSGQIYNRKYWKVPIVYGALGYAGYSMVNNRSNLRTLNDSIASIFNAGKTPTAQLIAERDRYRGNRDIAILSMAGIYVLQAIDATVDAHFYKFNINDDIAVSGKISPQRWVSISIALR